MSSRPTSIGNSAATGAGCRAKEEITIGFGRGFDELANDSEELEDEDEDYTTTQWVYLKVDKINKIV